MPIGILPASNFVVGTSATNANQFFIYDDTIGELFFDADGNGTTTAIHFATLSAGLALTNQDFILSN